MQREKGKEFLKLIFVKTIFHENCWHRGEIYDSRNGKNFLIDVG